MKHFLLLLALMIFGTTTAFSETVSSSPSDNFDQARGLANFMEDHYGITILIGDECDTIKTEGFELGTVPFGRTPLLNLLSYVDYESEMERVDDCFSFYPGGFFSKFRCYEALKGLRILLADRITADGNLVGGVTTIQDGYYNIFLCIGIFNAINVHHELWHAIEYRITTEYPRAFNIWPKLNPIGFVYDEEYFLEDIWTYMEPNGNYFASKYSVINDMEDRATVIEAFFKKDKDWWADHPMIQRKLDVLIAAARPVFGNIYHEE